MSARHSDAYRRNPITPRRWRVAGGAVPVAGLLALLVAGCSSGPGSPASHPTTATSLPAGASSPASTPASTPASAAGMTLSWPRIIGGYELYSLEGQPVDAPVSNPGFLKTLTVATNAQDGAYTPEGGSFEEDGITVVAGQLKPGTKPASAIATMEASSASNSHLPNLDLVSVPPGSLGGQITCWDQPAYSSAPATAWCMWADASTYGLLGANPVAGKDPTSGVAQAVLGIRAGMEH
jgi:hypothetical protein